MKREQSGSTGSDAMGRPEISLSDAQDRVVKRLFPSGATLPFGGDALEAISERRLREHGPADLLGDFARWIETVKPIVEIPDKPWIDVTELVSKLAYGAFLSLSDLGAINSAAAPRLADVFKEHQAVFVEAEQSSEKTQNRPVSEVERLWIEASEKIFRAHDAGEIVLYGRRASLAEKIEGMEEEEIPKTFFAGGASLTASGSITLLPRRDAVGDRPSAAYWTAVRVRTAEVAKLLRATPTPAETVTKTAVREISEPEPRQIPADKFWENLIRMDTEAAKATKQRQ